LTGNTRSGKKILPDQKKGKRGANRGEKGRVAKKKTIFRSIGWRAPQKKKAEGAVKRMVIRSNNCREKPIALGGGQQQRQEEACPLRGRRTPGLTKKTPPAAGARRQEAFPGGEKESSTASRRKHDCRGGIVSAEHSEDRATVLNPQTRDKESCD